MKQDKRTNSFLSGNKWAEGKFATTEEISQCIKFIGKFDVIKPLPPEKCDLIESCINFCALQIIRYSASQWGNDYYEWVNTLGEITSFLDKHSKQHKYGKYFKL